MSTLKTFTHSKTGRPGNPGRYVTLAGSFLFAMLLGFPSAIMAFSVQHGPAVYVGKDQTIDGNLYAAGASITVDGHVTGDLICAGQSIIINGTVDGDIISAGQSITINGTVGGSVRAAGSNVLIDGKVERSLMAFAANLNVSGSGSVGWDALIVAASTQLTGRVGRSLLATGGIFLLDGPIGQDAVLYMGSDKGKDSSHLTVADSCSIGGNLQYTGTNEATISPKAQIKGKTTHNLPSVEEVKEGPGVGGTIAWLLVSVLSALMVGLVLAGVAGPVVVNMTDDMLARFWPAFGWGALWSLATPFAALLVAITVVGIRLALLSAGIWLILLGVAKIITGIAIGRLLLMKYWPVKKDSLIAATLAGTVICGLVFHIPFLGWLLSGLAVWWGMGGIMLYAGRQYAGMKGR